MKKLIAVLLTLCLMASLSCAALADDGTGVTDNQPQYLSWLTARRAIVKNQIDGGFVKVPDYNVIIWVPDVLEVQDTLPDDSYQAWFKTADGSAEVGIQAMDMGQGFSLDKYADQLEEQGLKGYGIHVVNGLNGLVFGNEETDNLSVAFVCDDTEAVYFSFYPMSDENFNQMAMIMLSSIQPSSIGLSDIADMIDTDLLMYWGVNRKVSFNDDDGSILVSIWDTGVNSDNIKSSSNFDAVKDAFVELGEFYMDSLEELNASDVHLTMQYVADEDDAAFLTFIDGELVYDVSAQ